MSKTELSRDTFTDSLYDSLRKVKLEQTELGFNKSSLNESRLA